MAAREENITKAAKLLHMTQPTLSRQLMQLETELGVKLFKRSKHSIILTDDGMLLKRRAQEMIALAEKTELEFSRRKNTLSGEIAIGCGETRNMDFLAKQIASFRNQYPLVQFSLYTATADDIKDRIENGILDMGLLLEPVEISKYEAIRMPLYEQWGVLACRDSYLAKKVFVRPEDLASTPLIIAQRDIVRTKLSQWFGDYYDGLEIAGTYTLILNALYLVENRVGVALTFRFENIADHFCFVPLNPALEAGAVLVWKKHQAVSPATARFVEHIKNA